MAVSTTSESERISKAPEERRQDIVDAARDLYESRGMSRTTIKDITDQVGVARGLFYYYFPDKDAVTEAVLDVYVAEFVEEVADWDASRTHGDIVGALRSAISLLRRSLFSAEEHKRNIAFSSNARLNNAFTDRAIDEVVKCIQRTTVEDYSHYHLIEIDNIHETFFVLIYGLIGLLRREPDIDDKTLMCIVSQTLHLDVNNEKPVEETGVGRTTKA